MGKKEKIPVFQKSRAGVKIAISIWMLAVFIFHLFMFPPPPLLTLTEMMGFSKQFLELQNQVKPFFQTTDFSDYITDQQTQ